MHMQGYNKISLAQNGVPEHNSLFETTLSHRPNPAEEFDAFMNELSQVNDKIEFTQQVPLFTRRRDFTPNNPRARKEDHGPSRLHSRLKPLVQKKSGSRTLASRRLYFKPMRTQKETRRGKSAASCRHSLTLPSTVAAALPRKSCHSCHYRRGDCRPGPVCLYAWQLFFPLWNP